MTIGKPHACGLILIALAAILAAQDSPGPETAKAPAIADALATLSPLARERPLRVQFAAGWTSSGATVIRAVAEVTRRSSSGEDWSRGGDVEATLFDASGGTIAANKVSMSAGTFVASVTLTPRAVLAPGDYRLQVHVKTVGSLGSTEIVRFTLSAAPAASGAVFLRSGVSTGNQDVPTADARFRRTERLILEMPVAPTGDVATRVLDRTGKELTLLVKSSVRDAADGLRWQRVEVTLAPLAPGDYLVESTRGSERTLIAFRLVP